MPTGFELPPLPPTHDPRLFVDPAEYQMTIYVFAVAVVVVGGIVVVVLLRRVRRRDQTDGATTPSGTLSAPLILQAYFGCVFIAALASVLIWFVAR